METIDIEDLFNKWGIDMTATEVIEKWSEPQRMYHSMSHLNDLIYQIKNHSSLTDSQKELLYVTAIFHDIVYIPGRIDNEMNSVSLFFTKTINKSNKILEIREIAKIILDTKNHNPTTELSQIFMEMDMDIVKRDYQKLLEWEEGIEYEYSYMEKEKYKRERIYFLNKMAATYPENADNLMKLAEHIESK
jgi:predicted metal-dependent HD superfamily phosphohydrolase